TGQIQGVQAAGNMHGEGVLRENLRGAVIGQPAAVPDAVAGERREGLFGIAYAISPGAKAKDADGFEEEFAELGGAFVVAPVADPDKVAGVRLAGNGVEHARIGRFMPDMGRNIRMRALVTAAERLAESENPVITGEVVGGHPGGIGDSAVVR